MNQLRHESGGLFRRRAAGSAFAKRRQEPPFVGARSSDGRSALRRLGNVLVATRHLVTRASSLVSLLKRLVPDPRLRTTHALKRHIHIRACQSSTRESAHRLWRRNAHDSRTRAAACDSQDDTTGRAATNSPNPKPPTHIIELPRQRRQGSLSFRRSQLEHPPYRSCSAPPGSLSPKVAVVS